MTSRTINPFPRCPKPFQGKTGCQICHFIAIVRIPPQAENTTQQKIAICCPLLQELARPLLSYFGGGVSAAASNSGLGGQFDSGPWTAYFHLGVAFVASAPVLQLENYSSCKRQRILDAYGDMRLQMALQLLSLWAHLGPHKLNFIPGTCSRSEAWYFLALFKSNVCFSPASTQRT